MLVTVAEDSAHEGREPGALRFLLGWTALLGLIKNTGSTLQPGHCYLRAATPDKHQAAQTSTKGQPSAQSAPMMSATIIILNTYANKLTMLTLL